MKGYNAIKQNGKLHIPCEPIRKMLNTVTTPAGKKTGVVTVREKKTDEKMLSADRSRNKKRRKL